MVSHMAFVHNAIYCVVQKNSLSLLIWLQELLLLIMKSCNYNDKAHDANANEFHYCISIPNPNTL